MWCVIKTCKHNIIATAVSSIWLSYRKSTCWSVIVCSNLVCGKIVQPTCAACVRLYLQSFLNFMFVVSFQIFLFHLRSCNVTFHSSLTVQSSARQSNLFTNRTTVLGLYSVLIPCRFITYWLVENMNIEVIPYRMPLDVCV